MSGVVQNTVTGLFVIGNALIFALGAYFLQRETITLGTVYLLFQYSSILMLPLILLTREIQDLQRAKASLQRLQSLFDRTSKIGATSNQLLAEGAMAIEADDLSFGYNEAEPVLKQISFHLAPKRVLGLLGRTGSGKTTLARLLFRLYDLDAGKLAINHIDIRQLKPQALRQRIGLVTQDVQLFHASVRDNLTLFQGNIPDPVILQAIDALKLGAWYAGLAQGLDTILGAQGQGLSEGEAQLFAFVRVFLKDPDLIILDEASSRLDPATEQLIEKAVTQLLDQRTGIIIAHRLNTLARVDDIMILEDGRIREYGPRATLAQDQTSYFAQLLQTGLQEVLT
jgi:ATP-binding cassette, subfamily B, bacterial